MTNRSNARILVTGVDKLGRSCVLQETTLMPPGGGAEGFNHATLYKAPSVPPPTRPEGHGNLLDMGLLPGQVQWIAVQYEPNQFYPMHHTDTVDLDIVLEGTIELQLDDGSHILQAGDGAIIAGVDHAWKSGPEGCRLSVTFIGTALR